MRLCLYYRHRSASCHCCLWKSSSAPQSSCTRTLVDLLLLSAASDSISNFVIMHVRHCSYIPTRTTVDCIPERYSKNRGSTPYCKIICLASHSAMMSCGKSHKHVLHMHTYNLVFASNCYSYMYIMLTHIHSHTYTHTHTQGVSPHPRCRKGLR